ncbi:MAG: hypothetical protein A2X28_02125 [Elusimicrobia bacterium GWA2_56_46]|nr:MAG: hypothetical protein A2X28_02125 [Elusimicrobia bacterium GWA2_56_46]OGR55433.1 MAG: hypothetical protein A2X39_00840 [Elusimicrobia bacterium GWC2_56_31]HBW21899.1 hypothetical protein [Elusimicrobiota bacterium]
MSAPILPFASLAGYFLFLLRFTSWPGAFLPFFTVSTLMCLLYAAAMAGLLLPAARCLTALGLIAGITGAYFPIPSFRRPVLRSPGEAGKPESSPLSRPKEYLARLLEPGTAVFLLLSFLLWLAFKGAQYSFFDEFSHWGLTIKEIFARNSLIPKDSVLICKDYPPATALFQYYTLISTGWSEGMTCFAQAAITLSAAVTFLTGLPWRQWLKMAAILIVLHLLMVIFGFSLPSVYVDHILGFFFGALLASYFISDDRGPAAVLRLLPALFILPLIKAAGIIFALTAAAIITADQLRGPGARQPNPAGSRLPVRLGLCALILLAPVVSAKTWSRHVDKMGISITLPLKAGLADIKRPFSAAATERDKTTLLNFENAFFSKRAKNSLPPFFMALLLTALGILLAKKGKHPGENAWIRTSTLLTLAGFIAYSAGILFLYLYSFTGYEGPRLASFGRYMSIFFMAWALLAAVFFLRGPAAGDSRLLPAWAKALIILVGTGLILNGAIHQPPAKKTEFRKIINEKAARALSLMPAGARTYLVWQNDNGYGPQVLAYELAPNPTSLPLGAAWSLGKPYSPGDVWTADLTPDAWQKTLKDYDYVLLGGADKIFWDRYGGLFENQPEARKEYFFKVTVKNGKARLLAAGR